MISRIVLCMFLLLLYGCGNEKESSVRLQFWHGIESAQNIGLLEKKVAEFEENHPGIQIDLQNIGAQDKAMPKIVTAIASGEEPNLLWFAPVYTGKFAESGKLVEAEKFFAGDESFDPADIYRGLLNSGRYKGSVYTVPFETNCLAVYYNKKHFEEAGIKELPDTWKMFAEVAKKLTIDADADGEPERYGFLIPLGTEEWTVWCWQTFLWQAGGEILSSDGSKALFQKKAGIAALSFLVDLKYEHNCAMFSARNAGYKLDPFISGKVSMMINGPWNYPILKKQSRVDYGSFILPMEEKRATNIGGENLYIFKSSPVEEQASWEFASYVMSEKFQTEWAIKTGYLPVNKKAAGSKEYKKFLEENPFIGTYVKSMSFGRCRPPVPEYSRISRRLGKAIEKALYSAMTPAQALKKASEECTVILTGE